MEKKIQRKIKREKKRLHEEMERQRYDEMVRVAKLKYPSPKEHLGLMTWFVILLLSFIVTTCGLWTCRIEDSFGWIIAQGISLFLCVCSLMVFAIARLEPEMIGKAGSLRVMTDG